MTVHRLTPQEVAALTEAVLDVTASASSDPDSFMAQVDGCHVHVPRGVRGALERFREHGSPTGSLLISGFTCGSVPPTPPTNACHVGAGTDLAKVQAVLNQVVGEMVAYEAEGYGRLFQDMVPSSALRRSQTSMGSGVALEIHTEQAFSDVRPDALSLACLRGDAAAKTFTMHVRQILDRVTPEQAALMRLPLWTVGVDDSFKMSGLALADAGPRGPVPILYGPEEDPKLVFDQDLMRGVTEEAEAVRAAVVELYYAHRHEHVLAPGDVLFVDNRRAVHGRSAFRPSFDGGDRFIVRSFVVHDYSVSAHARVGRVVQAAFS